MFDGGVPAQLIISVPLLYLLSVSYFLWVTDIREHRLPNKYTVVGIALSTLCTVIASAVTQNYAALVTAFAVASVLFGIGVLLSIRGWLGMGDNKLILAFSLPLAWLDFQLVLIGLALALLAANLRVLAGFLTSRRIGNSIALGPYLLIGFFASFGLWFMPGEVLS